METNDVVEYELVPIRELFARKEEDPAALQELARGVEFDEDAYVLRRKAPTWKTSALKMRARKR